MSKSSKHSKLSRRDALAKLGVFGGAAALASCKREWTPAEQDPFGLARSKPYVPGAEAWGTHEERWANSSCAQCSAGCGIRVRVVEGRAVRIDGNKSNPLNRGGIGPRGISGLQVLYDPDRITGPMIRKGGTLSPVSWDEALETVGDALRRLRAKDEAHRLLLMSGRERGMMNDLLQRFAQAYGTPNFVDGRPSHSSTLAQVMEEATGSFEVPAFDWAGADYVLSLEAGILEDSCQAVYFARVAAERRNGSKRRSKLVHAGPTFDLNAYNSDEWLRLSPGTSGALALGLCHELLSTDRYDHSAVEDKTVGLADFSKAVRRFTPEHVAKVTGVSPEQLKRVATQLWENRPSFVYIDERSLSYSNGRDTALAVMALNTLLGALEASSGGMRIAPVAPTRPWPSVTLDTRASKGLEFPRLDLAGTKEFPRARSVHETLVTAIEKNTPELALLYYTNPAYARPQPTRWRDALAKIPLIVSFSPFRDETVEELAHVVLPDHTYLERYEDAGCAPGLTQAVQGVRKPVVVPLHDTRASGDLILDLARRVGDGVAEAFPWKSFREAIDFRLLGLHDANRGSIRAPSERAFLEKLFDEAVWVDREVPPQPVRFELPTTWSEATWSGNNVEYPLKLVLYHSIGHAEGSGANQPWLHQLRTHQDSRAWDHAALVHPSSVPGLKNGDLARITSPSGEVVMPLRLEARMLPGFVAISLGRGHTAFGRFAKGIGINAMTLVNPGPAAITGASVLCSTRVKIQGERHA